MMKHAFWLLTLIVALTLTGCRRDYKVIHVRPAVDSAAVTEQQSVEVVESPDVDSALLDEPLIEIPDIPQEVDITNTEGRDEYDDYIHGR